MKKIYLIMFICSFTATIFAQEKTKPIRENDQVESPKQVKIEQISKIAQNNAVNAVVSYDFTTGSDKYHGGAAAAKDLGGGVWGMIAGDANADGTVNAIDFNDHWLPQNGTAYTYSKTADFNLDGTINAVDYNSYWLLNNGKATQVPN